MFWYMTQLSTQITDLKLCQVNVPTLTKDWLKEKVNLLTVILTCKEKNLSEASDSWGHTLYSSDSLFTPVDGGRKYLILLMLKR